MERFIAWTVQIYGVTVDEADSREKLKGYSEKFQPAYQLLSKLEDVDREHVQKIVFDSLNTDAMPSSIVTDSQGKVLLVTPGIPTISQVRKLMNGGSSSE